MNLNTCRHNQKPGDGKILFPNLQSWNPMTRVATIAADVDGKRVLCRISGEDLKKRFDKSADKPMQVVTEFRSRIETAARMLIENRQFEEDGSVLVRYRDL